MAAEYGRTEYGSVPGGATDVNVSAAVVDLIVEGQSPEVKISKTVGVSEQTANVTANSVTVLAQSKIVGGPTEISVKPQSPTVNTQANVEVQGAVVSASVGANAVTVSGDSYHDEGVNAQQLKVSVPGATVSATQNVDVTAGPAVISVTLPNYEVKISKEVELTNTPMLNATGEPVTVTVTRNVEINAETLELNINAGRYFAIVNIWDEKDESYDDGNFWSEKQPEYDDGDFWDTKDPKY